MKWIHILLCLSAMVFIAPAAFAADTAAPINKKCPVEGEDIDPSVTTVQDGKTVGFCCKSCIAKFKKDPAMYMKKLADAGDDNSAKSDKAATPGKLNAKCPVHPENAVDPTETTEYKGKKIGFCCEDCRKAFESNPEKYVSRLK